MQTVIYNHTRIPEIYQYGWLFADYVPLYRKLQIPQVRCIDKHNVSGIYEAHAKRRAFPHLASVRSGENH
jgi:hypothetical protein